MSFNSYVVPAQAGTQYTRDYRLISNSCVYWMPAFAGMTAGVARGSLFPRTSGAWPHRRLHVVPAKAGTQYTRDYRLISNSCVYWMLAFAGMTTSVTLGSLFPCTSGAWPRRCLLVVPAKAGTQYTLDYRLISNSCVCWMPAFAGMTVESGPANLTRSTPTPTSPSASPRSATASGRRGCWRCGCRPRSSSRSPAP